MCRDTVLPCLFACFVLLVTSGDTIEIFVAKNGTSDTSCLTGGAKNPCNNLTMVLEDASRSNNVIISLYSGSFDLLPSMHATFQSVDGVAIRGIEDLAIIRCADGAGLTFVDSKNINISRVTITGCGMLHNSTSLERQTATTGLFMEFNASVYFLLCVNVAISETEVSNSTGIGIQMYATTGINTISRSNIANNPAMGTSWAKGGGVYIEFPYCLPGSMNCNDSHSDVLPVYVSNSSYSISDTTFSNNHAGVAGSRVLFPYKTTHNAFGRGGGLSVFFNGKADNNTLDVLNCRFSNNSASYGGGFLVQFEDESSGNTLHSTGNEFLENQVTNGGGGLKIGILSIYDLQNQNNTVQIGDNTFVGNKADWGGGTALWAAKEKSGPTNALTLTNCTWKNNTAKVGSAVDVSVYRPVTVGLVLGVTFKQCHFLDNSVDYTKDMGKPLGTGAVYLNAISATFEDYVVFDGNYDGSALAVIDAYIYFATNTTAIFVNNTGRNGGAISMLGGGCIQLQENTTLVFDNNTATGMGGAIYNYYGGSHELYAIHDCFIEYYKPQLKPSKWKTSLYFNNNRASQQENAIFSTTIIPCLWETGDNTNDKSNNSKNAFCWNGDVAEWLYDGKEDIDTCSSHIWTDPAFFNSSKGLNITVIPGQPQIMPFTAVDDQEKNATSLLLFTVQSQTEGVKVDQEYRYSDGNKILLYTNKSQNITEGVLLLQTLGPRALETQLTVTFEDCPLGFELNEKGACACVTAQEFRGYVRCNQSSLKTDILQGYWIGKFPHSSTTVVGYCYYCIRDPFSDTQFITLNDTNPNKQLCGDWRNGTLCSTCVDGYAPAVNRENYECVGCKHNLIIGAVLLHKVIAPVVLFLTMFFLFCFYDVSPATGALNRVIFFAQMVTTAVRINEDVKMSPAMHDIITGLKYFYTPLYDIWNLEFCNSCLPAYCLYPNTTAIQVIIANYAVALLPLLMVLLVMIVFVYNGCCKLCQQLFEQHRERVKKALMLLILLSYVKIAVTTSYVLTPTYLYTANGLQYKDSVLHFDSDIVYFGGEEHLLYAIPALLFGGVYGLLLPLLLIIYRFNKPDKNSGFFNHLLKEFQEEFKEGDPRAILNDDDIQYKDDWCGLPTNRIKYGGKVRVERPWRSEDDEGTLCSCWCRYTPIWVEWCRRFESCCSCFFFTSWSRNDFRWLAGVYFLVRVWLLLCVAIFFPMVQCTLQFMLCIIMVTFVALFQPYKESRNNKLDCVMFVGLAIITVLNMLQESKVIAWSNLYLSVLLVQYAVLVIPACWMFYKFIMGCKVCVKLYRRKKVAAQNVMRDVDGGENEKDELLINPDA